MHSPIRLGGWLCFFLLLVSTLDAAVRLEQLRCEHAENPIGIGIREPRLSWKLRSSRRGEVQTAYEIRAADSVDALQRDAALLWTSGQVISDQSVLVPWRGPMLKSRDRVFWKVRVWDKNNRPTAWSDAAYFELGLLEPKSEWHAHWITSEIPRHDILGTLMTSASWISGGSTASQSASARLSLVLPQGAVVRRASIDAAGDGLLTIFANGNATRQGSSSRTAPLHADVGEQLRPGTNIIGIGSAAVRGAVRRNLQGPGRNAIAARGVVELEDGSQIEFNTGQTLEGMGQSWRAAINPPTNWFAPGFDDSEWAPAIVHGTYAANPSQFVDHTIGPARYFRKDFQANRQPARARLYAAALGTYDVSINGRRVHDSLLNPGWTDYKQRVMMQTYDVTRFISRGSNAIGAVLTDGWYAGRVGWMGLAQYGSRPAFAAQLELTYSDGSTEVIATDASWKAGAGQIAGSDMQWGETIDARLAQPGWDEPLFNGHSWARAEVEKHDIPLSPQVGPPVRRVMELAPREIKRRGDRWIVDFGQNLVGFVRLTTHGPAGTTIVLRHGEMLDADGGLYVENLRPALSTDTFILNGKSGRETFEPRFTFHGFRYVEITGFPGRRLSSDAIRAVAVSSDTPFNGRWESSDPNLNRLYQNIVWSQRGNFLSVPTDCPQRDERMGWTGDALVFASTAARNADVAGFFSKWLIDVADAQGSRGEIPTVIPRANQNNSWAVWGDAGVIVPWVMYQSYGDTAFLANHYTNMVRWVEFSRESSSDLIRSGGVGDHLAPQRTPVDVVATAFFANSASIAARTASILGKPDDAARYETLHRDIVAAFNRAFVSSNGIVRGDSQTAYILALQFNLLPEHLRADAAARLARNIETSGHLTTGFVGVGLICPVLTQIGRPDLAWRLVLNDTYPSWLFSVKNGATTIWERWDGWTPERGFQDSSMNSFNHYSFGAVGEWLFSSGAGIHRDDNQPGYRHFFLRPQFTPRLRYIKAAQETPYGTISSHWRIRGNQIDYDVTVPPNSSATFELPLEAGRVRESGKPLRSQTAGTRVRLEAGKYRFSFPAADLMGSE
ncbi:MAG TPA: family 78 glycoside hydrolase catalytic domain [Verrucomicrobiae bacterium]|nr:family 78 glycoside hydrolase catalytic domain [Verrucomicrobiae bacterium]